MKHVEPPTRDVRGPSVRAREGPHQRVAATERELRDHLALADFAKCCPLRIPPIGPIERLNFVRYRARSSPLLRRTPIPRVARCPPRRGYLNEAAACAAQRSSARGSNQPAPALEPSAGGPPWQWIADR